VVVLIGWNRRNKVCLFNRAMGRENQMGTVRFFAQGDGVTTLSPILHVRLFHPVDDHYGFSPIEAASVAIDTHNAASRWNKALLDNAARPSGALGSLAGSAPLRRRPRGTAFSRTIRTLENGTPRRLPRRKECGSPIAFGRWPRLETAFTHSGRTRFSQRETWCRPRNCISPRRPTPIARHPRRQHVLQLRRGQRTTRSLSTWLAPAYSAALTLRPDLDQIEALAPEREALWSRLQAATFLTDDEKRAAAGYGPKPATKANPFHDDRGRFTFSPDGSGDVHLIQGRPGRGRGGIPTSPAQETRFALADARAKNAIRRVGERDPTWKPTPQLTNPNSVEGAISAREATAAEAEARLAELLRGSVPGLNPDWGVRRVENELRGKGFVFKEATRNPGKMFVNPRTNEEVRIMERPDTPPYRSESAQKRLSDFYYRYRSGPDQAWGQHILIPNK
jgi:Phage portal protein